MMPDGEFNRRMLRTVLTVAAVALLAATMWAARAALMLIYISALIAMGFSPAVRVLQQPHWRSRTRHVPRWLAILVIYGAIVFVLALLGLMVVPPLVAQAAALWARLPTEFSRLQVFLLTHNLLARPATLFEAVQNAPAGSGANAVNAALVAVYSLIGGVFGLVTILILSFYLLVEGEPMFEYLLRLVPPERRAHVATAAREAVVKVSAWLQAQLILAGVMGTFSAIGLGLMGVPYFYVVALIAAVGETIPIIGPILAGATAVAVALSASPKLALVVGAYFLVLHQLEANILIPKIMERKVGVSPVTVMTALLVGGELWGLIGAILAIPTAAILAVVVDEFLIER